MDQRFPLHATLPSQRAIASLPPLETTSRGSTDTPPSPIPDTSNPESSLPSQRVSLPAAASPSAISPSSSSSIGGPPTFLPQNNSTVLPPTISALEQPRPTHLTNPLPFQHEYRSQVPVEGEYPLSIANQDAIVSAPPPYTRRAPLPKSGGEQPRSRLQLIDVSAAVRALPTVPTAAVGQGDYTSSARSPSSEDPIASCIHPSGSITHHDSNTGLSIQSEQGTNSNVLLLQGGGETKEVQYGSVRRLCGIKLWWILLAIALILILFAIILGVTLGMVLKQNRNSQPNNQGNKPPPPPKFPPSAAMDFKPTDQSRACFPDQFPQNASWACQLPPVSLRFEIEDKDTAHDTFPPMLSDGFPGPDDWSQVITSVNGLNPINGTYEGVQPFNFSQQPLYKIPEDGNDKLRKRDGNCKYQFRVLYTREIVLRRPTFDKLNGKSDQVFQDSQDQLPGEKINDGEPVLLCEWKGTLIEGKVWMEGGEGPGPGSGGSVRMTLSETYDYIDPHKGGDISCSEGKFFQGKFVQRKAKDSKEKDAAVHKRVVARNRYVRKWGGLPVYKRDEGPRQCSCSWDSI